jgi:hypothetical protein
MFPKDLQRALDERIVLSSGQQGRDEVSITA